MAQKMLVGDKDTVLLIPAFELNGIPQAAMPGAAAQPLNAITSAMLNAYITANTPSQTNAHWGGNITCAVLDDWKLGMKDSSTKQVTTLCSVGQAQELTFYNFDAQMNFLNDVNPFDTASEFNVPNNLTTAPDVPYIIAHRVGYSRVTAAAAAQEWNFYYAWTDLPINAFSDGEYQQTGQTFVPKGLINFKSILAS